MKNKDANGEIILPEEAKQALSDFIEAVDYRLMDKMLRHLLIGYLKNNKGGNDLWFCDGGIDQLIWLYYLNDTFEEHFAERNRECEDDGEKNETIANLGKIIQELKKQSEYWREFINETLENYRKMGKEFSALLGKSGIERASEHLKLVEEHQKWVESHLKSLGIAPGPQ
jgi:hypothetical protein